MNKRKYTKRNPRRSARLLKKQKMTVELPYEMWLYIANFLPITFLRATVKHKTAWSTKHWIFTAFQESFAQRLKNILGFVNFEKLSLYPRITNATLMTEADNLKKHFKKSYALLIQLLCQREQMASLKSVLTIGSHQRLQTIAKAFCRVWLQAILQENTTFSFAFTPTLSGAKVPQDSEKFWDQTRLFSFYISNCFLRYHYDFHLKVSQMDSKKNAQLHCCFPGKWECDPSCENRRWPTWALMELRGRLNNLMKHGLAWLCEKQFANLGLYLSERYCCLEEGTATFTHVYVGADCLYPPN